MLQAVFFFELLSDALAEANQGRLIVLGDPEATLAVPFVHSSDQENRQ